MSVASRQNKNRKEPANHPRRGGGPGGAWRGAHNNPSIMHQQQQQQNNFGGGGGSPIPNNTPGNRMSLPPNISMNNQSLNSGGPPSNYAQPPPQHNNTNYNNNPNAVASPGPPGPSLPPAHLIGQMLNVNTRTGSRHQGILTAPEPQQPPGIALKDAKDVVNPGAPIVDLFFIHAQQIANWHVPDMNAQPPAGNIGKALDSFRTDTDISNQTLRKDRELKAWRPDASTPPSHPTTTDSLETSAAPFAANHVNGSWDQFAANEKLFGMTTNYDEEMYTTKLDRNAVDYKERERRAQQIANEIIGVTSSNPHVREERGLDDSGLNEEDKYGAVVRGPNAYVPPAARRQQEANGLTKSPTAGAPSAKAPTTRPADVSKAAQTPPAGVPPPGTASPRPAANASNSAASIPKVSVNPPDGGPVTHPLKPGNPTAATPVASPPAAQGNGEQPASVVASFKDFVSNEKQRLAQKKQAIQKSEKDKRLADLIKFSSSFKLNQPIPEDLVTILSKDEHKQKEIVEKSMKDAAASNARAIAQAPPTVPVANGAAAANTTGRTPAAAAAVAAGASGAVGGNGAAPFNPKTMVVQAIPPFRGPKSTATNKPISAPSNAKSAAQPQAPLPAQPTGAAASTIPTVKSGDFVPAKKTTIRMSIPAIPPFDPSKRRSAGTEGANNGNVTNAATNKSNNLPSGTPAAGKLSVAKTSAGGSAHAPASPTGSAGSSNSNAFKLSGTASSFRPSANAPAFKPAGSNLSSAPAGKPKPEEPAAAQPPNPFFGTRQIKKGNPVHLKDDFNPFKFAKVAEAAAVPFTWPFTGKRYMAMFPPIPHPAPAPAPPPPPPYEEESAVQAAQQAQARMGGYPMMYSYPYQYPNQPPQPHMMVAANTGPPGGYMQPQFVPHMPYPPPIPPNASQGMYPPPQMGGMPPPGPTYMPQPPQGAYPPGGGPRGSMPPTPLPQHAYAAAYHHQSPQMAHAHVPYALMMPPPGGPPHGYDGQQAPQGPMGVGH